MSSARPSAVCTCLHHFEHQKYVNSFFFNMYFFPAAQTFKVSPPINSRRARGAAAAAAARAAAGVAKTVAAIRTTEEALSLPLALPTKKMVPSFLHPTLRTSNAARDHQPPTGCVLRARDDSSFTGQWIPSLASGRHRSQRCQITMLYGSATLSKPCTTALPFWGQINSNSKELVPKNECGFGDKLTLIPRNWSLKTSAVSGTN